MGKELANYAYRLNTQLLKVEDFKFTAKVNGATGNYSAQVAAMPHAALVPYWNAKFIQDHLKLGFNDYTTQIEPHDNKAEFFHIMMRINTILIDFCRDIWGYISLGYFKQKVIEGEVGSSTMPHKVNPIDFENAEGNLGVANALFGHFADKLPISRFQRDLSDSTVQRNIGVAFAHSLIAYKAILKGLDKLSLDEIKMHREVSESWELLAEPIQTILRINNVPNAYEMLKDFSRGGKITREDVQEFINNLQVDEKIKDQLRQLRPETYLGLAVELSEGV
jgi:adenylosuccinate lyase